MAKIREEELTQFLEKKIDKLESRLIKVKAALEKLKVTHDVTEVKLKKGSQIHQKSSFKRQEKK